MSKLPATFIKEFHNEEAVRKMVYTELGKTGLKISKLSLGGASFAPIYGHDNETEAIRTIHESLQNGINYIDTAPYYGQGKSESIIGKALKNVPRGAYYIATKVGRYECGKDGFDFKAATTRQSIDISLKRLQLDYIDIIQIHDIEFADNVDTIINETLPALEEAKKQGKLRFIGVTGYPIEPLKEAILKGSSRFDERNVGVICAAATALGILTNHGEFEWHVASVEIKKMGRLCAAYCKEKGVELGRLAVWYTAQLQGPATCLVGMPTTEILANNLDVFWNGLTQAEMTTLKYCLESLILSANSHWEDVEMKQLFIR